MQDYALLVGYGMGWPALPTRQVVAREMIWLAGFAALIGLGVNAPNAWVSHLSGASPMPLRLPAYPLLVILVCLAFLLHLPSLWLGSVVLGCRKRNYLGRSLPGAAGLLVPLIAFPSAWLFPSSSPLRPIIAIVVGSFAAVGLLDDLFGHLGKARGLRGHFTALLRGRITTGALKAVGGLAAGLIAASLMPLARLQPLLIPVDGMIIALTANLLNLLDLRPGRALKGFALLAGLLLLHALYSGRMLPLLGPALAAALVLAPSDLAGRTMLGDVGANTLGGLAGLALVFVLPPAGRLAALALLLALHLYCERASLTDLIARNRLLRFLDQLGTRHLPPLEREETA